MVILNKKAKCCITGYNSYELPYGEDLAHPDCKAMRERLEQEIIQQLENGVYQFFIGMDCGVELWSAEMLLKLQDRYPHIKINPVISSEEMTYNWSDESHELYWDDVMPNCEDEFRIENRHTMDCISRRNEHLTNWCNIILAVYDGKEDTSTGEIVRLATEKQKKIILLDC